MRPVDASVWARRYQDALAPGVIKARAEVRAQATQNLAAVDVEDACRQLEVGMKQILLVTAQTESIMRSLIQRALAHAKATYKDPKVILECIYEGIEMSDDVTPALITGLAGVGKSCLSKMLARTLNGRQTLSVDPSHPCVQLIDYLGVQIAQKRSTASVLRDLVRVETNEDPLPDIRGDQANRIARWLRQNGVCLFGADEFQFMAQSEVATALITKSMLALASLQVPWLVVCNYSMVWKLRGRRGSEARQRLLGDPMVIFPELPDSVDWLELLKEYQVVLGDAVGFKLVDQSQDLWNYCAGLKRELVKLLILAYRFGRMAGATAFSWAHVTQAFMSRQFCDSREDINSLIAHAGQGGPLRQDLRCPFSGPEMQLHVDAYSAKLREVRANEVARATVRAGMTAPEEMAIRQIEKAAEPPLQPKSKVVQIKSRSTRPTLASLLESGQALIAAPTNLDQAKPSPSGNS